MVKFDLILAARDGNTELVESHIGEAGKKGKGGRTALITAAEHSHIDCIRLLLPHEAGLQNSRGETALHYAALQRSPQAVKLLAQYECKIQTSSGLTALMFAALKGTLSCVYLLLEQEARIQCALGWTALMRAVKSDNVACTKALLCEAGLQAKDGTSALILATLRNNPDIVALLLPYERDLVDANGHTAQWHAENPLAQDGEPLPGDFTAVRDLFKASTTPILPAPEVTTYPLLIAAITGDLEMAQKNAALIGECYDDGQTALMYAAQYGHHELVNFLLKEESKFQDNYGSPALFYAIKHRHLHCAKCLLCEASIRDVDLNTSFERALQYENEYNETCMFLRCLFKTKEGTEYILSELDAGREEEVFVLLRRIFELTNDATGLICVATLGSFPLVERLLEQAGIQLMNSLTALMSTVIVEDYEYWWGWDYSQGPEEEGINEARTERLKIITALLPKEKGMKDAQGWTALMHAIYRGSLDYAMLLVDEASAQSTTEALGKCPGTTALMLAAYNGYEDILPALRRERGLLDADGKTALFYALYSGNIMCIPELAEEVGVVDSQYRTQFSVIRAHLSFEIAEYVYEEACPVLEEAYQRIILSGITHTPPQYIVALLQRMPTTELQVIDGICATLLGEPDAFDELDEVLVAIEEEHAMDSCIVCYARQPDTILIPCKHLIVCEICADQLDLRCPYCRGDVTEALVLESAER